MSIELLERERQAKGRLAVVDCDIHPIFRSESQILPFLPARWREQLHALLGGSSGRWRPTPGSPR